MWPARRLEDVVPRTSRRLNTKDSKEQQRQWIEGAQESGYSRCVASRITVDIKVAAKHKSRARKGKKCIVKLFTYTPQAPERRSIGGKQTSVMGISLPSVFPSSSLIDWRKQSEYEGFQFMYREEKPDARENANKN